MAVPAVPCTNISDQWSLAGDNKTYSCHTCIHRFAYNSLQKRVLLKELFCCIYPETRIQINITWKGFFFFSSSLSCNARKIRYKKKNPSKSTKVRWNKCWPSYRCRSSRWVSWLKRYSPPKKKNLGDLQMFPTPRSHSQVSSHCNFNVNIYNKIYMY